MNAARVESAAASTADIPAGYRRAIRFGATWAMVTSPYIILFFLTTILISQVEGNPSSARDYLEIAGKNPFAYGATILADGFFHVVFFVTVVTLYATFRTRWPVFASLILVFGAGQMFFGFAKALNSFITFTSLGQAYLSGSAASKDALIGAGMAVDGLRMALQWMDSLGVMMVWVLVSLLPAAAGIPRPVRWLGWVLAVFILAPDPAFALVVFLLPIWQFWLGFWLRRQTAPAPVIAPQPGLESR